MRRWNGWGDEQTTYHLADSALAYLAGRIGPGTPVPDASLEQSLKAVPRSRLPEHPLVGTDTAARLLHARGQSLPDWVALRSGRISTYPDGVACPEDDTQVQALFAYASQSGAHIIPYGGGTSVVGHINPQPGDTPVLTVDLSHMNRLLALDETSQLATFGAGVNGPDLERQLNGRGYTLGHYPQSFELSTLGGWIAARSSGQQSYYYGRIEDLFAGGHVETPQGALDLPIQPASAAGPDLRQAVLGSEGRLGIITRAVVRIRPLPAAEAFHGVFFHSWEEGMAAMRQIAQDRVAVSMARLSNALETETTLRLSGKDDLVAWAERGLGLIGYGPERCLMIFGVTGQPAAVRHALGEARRVVRSHGGLFTGQTAGKIWRKSRFLAPYLRNILWERGYAVDTLETAVPWAQVPATAEAMQQALRGALAPWNERPWVFAHLSHIYTDGASIYVTYIFRRAAGPDETLARWQALKAAASQAVLAHDGTISHQHGVGSDHAPYLPQEKGELGMALLRHMVSALDPDGMLNPGKLLF